MMDIFIAFKNNIILFSSFVEWNSYVLKYIQIDLSGNLTTGKKDDGILQ